MKKWKKLVSGIMVTTMLATSLTGCGKPAKIDDFEKYAGTVADITVPEGVKVVALGEATHGNNEFQQLKLDVFKQLVETTDIRAFVLEGDFGGCALVNNFVQGGEGDSKEITELLGYNIYRTDNMKELVEWMRDYNATAEENDKVRIYGVDMQYDGRCVKLINAFYEKASAGKAAEVAAKIKELLGEDEDTYKPEDFDQIVALTEELTKDIEDNREAYAAATSELEVEYALCELRNLVYYMEYREKVNYSSKYRDNCMFENTKWIVEQEEKLGHSAVMLSGHNGHITKNLSTVATFLGNQLYEEYGEGYFAIGTDYYNTSDNVPDQNRNRVVKKFCSGDPLAYQVGDMDTNIAYLDFAKAAESEELSKLINNKMGTGSLGEQYSVMMKVMPNLTHVYFAPSEMYDAMIYVYDATPIEVWERDN